MNTQIYVPSLDITLTKKYKIMEIHRKINVNQSVPKYVPRLYDSCKSAPNI